MIDPDALRAIAEKINVLRDSLTESIKALEDKVNGFNLGLGAGVCFQDGQIYGYGLIGKRWCFYWQKNSKESVIPLVEAPLDARADFIDKAHVVLKALCLETVQITKEIREATKLANEFVEGIRSVQNGHD